MATFFLKNEEYESLKKLFFQMDLVDENDEEILEKSSIVYEDEDGNKKIDEYKISILKVCFFSEIYMLVKQNDKEEEDYYYLDEDQIIYAQKNSKGYTFMNLPSIKYAIGSIADYFWDEITSTEKEQFKISCCEKIDNGNYVTVLNNLLADSEYQFNMDKSDEKQIVFTGSVNNKVADFLVVVRIIDGKCFFYKCDTDLIMYGKTNRTDLTNLISHWILYKHRELIKTMIGEE